MSVSRPAREARWRMNECGAHCSHLLRLFDMCGALSTLTVGCSSPERTREDRRVAWSARGNVLQHQGPTVAAHAPLKVAALSEMLKTDDCEDLTDAACGARPWSGQAARQAEAPLESRGPASCAPGTVLSPVRPP